MKKKWEVHILDTESVTCTKHDNRLWPAMVFESEDDPKSLVISVYGFLACTLPGMEFDCTEEDHSQYVEEIKDMAITEGPPNYEEKCDYKCIMWKYSGYHREHFTILVGMFMEITPNYQKYLDENPEGDTK